MNKNTNAYIFLYAVAMVVIVAAALSFLATKLKPMQDQNEEVQKMQDILAAIQIESNADNAQDLYDKYITESKVIDSEGKEIENADAFEVQLKKELAKSIEDRNLPLFYGILENGEEKVIIPLRGKGLWGPIWGYMSFDNDYNTIYGASFDHKSETPGLGAEINTKAFQEQFVGKTIMNESAEFVSVDVVKGGAPDDAAHAVDAVSGGTITSHGLRDMLQDCISPYMTYFKNQREKGN